MDAKLNWVNILEKLENNLSLTRLEANWVMAEMMSGEAKKETVVDLLLKLRAKGESEQEIAGFVDVMLEKSVKIPVSQDAIDIVGTGGDQLGTVNISTMAAIVIAASGYPVLKHGSRSASGKTGSSEMLEALGVKLDLSPEQLAEVFNEIGITFFFAPLFHPALKHVAPIRKEMGVPTTFNFLGPLANPVQPIATALGVAKSEILPLIAGEMAQRGRSAIIFRGADGLDELTTTSNSYVNLVKNGTITSLDFNPASLGFQKAQVSDLVGADAQFNAQVARELFAGQIELGSPIGEIVALNAAVGISAYELAKTAADFSFLDSMQKNYQIAQEAIASGKALAKVQSWINLSQSFGE
jgi:anthranilate phosphoribosyltransferase